MRVLINMIKKIIFSSFLLYGFNIIAVNFNIVVPINVFTILLITILGVPGLLGLVLFKIFVLWGVVMDVTSAKKKYYEIINSIVNNNKISHAYMIEIDSYDDDFICVLDFVKMILGNNDDINNLIDIGNYPDLKIIEPDGSVIKKGQLIKLQEEFRNKSFLDNKMIYIIKEADKLNESSGNTILKFLEEPEDDIVAILVTTNRYKVIETILSRCQILSLQDSDNIVEVSDQIIDFISFLVKKNDLFVNYNTIFNDILPDKVVAKKLLSDVEYILIKYLNYCADGGKTKCNMDVVKLLCKLDNDKIIDFIAIIEEDIDKLNYNINYKLWLDCLFARLIGG